MGACLSSSPAPHEPSPGTLSLAGTHVRRRSLRLEGVQGSSESAKDSSLLFSFLFKAWGRPASSDALVLCPLPSSPGPALPSRASLSRVLAVLFPRASSWSRPSRKGPWGGHRGWTAPAATSATSSATSATSAATATMASATSAATATPILPLGAHLLVRGAAPPPPAVLSRARCSRPHPRGLYFRPEGTLPCSPGVNAVRGFSHLRPRWSAF